jgi:hypothetical protein
MRDGGRYNGLQKNQYNKPYGVKNKRNQMVYKSEARLFVGGIRVPGADQCLMWIAGCG